MSVVKSYSFPVGDIRGDCFYIQHDSSNFTIIDCYLKDGGDASCRKDEIINEILAASKGRIRRFISSHPDTDHIVGIEELNKVWPIKNFYAVENDVPSDRNNPSLEKYLELKEHHNCPLKAGLERVWLNLSKDGRDGSNLEILWPDPENPKFRDALEATRNGASPNNISCVVRYDAPTGGSYLWMGDMETGMQEEFFRVKRTSIKPVDVLFQPHHGRSSGKVPAGLLKALAPRIIVVGNAPAKDIYYANPEKTITQNTAGDIVFVNCNGYIHVFTRYQIDNAPKCLQNKDSSPPIPEFNYLGSILSRKRRDSVLGFLKKQLRIYNQDNEEI